MALVLVLPTPQLASSATGVVTEENLWTNPPATTIKRISNTSPHQNEPVYLSNLDCTLQTYRIVGSPQMQTGCFTPTAYGLIDSDSDNVIYNGTDEAVHFYPYSPHQVLAPWPRAMNLLALDAQNSGGVALSMYKNPLLHTTDVHDVFGLLNGKQLTAPPELPLKSAAGKPLIVNGQSIAFAEGGGWMIAEVLGGSFVRINLGTLQQKPFAVTYSRAGSAALDSSSVTVSRDGRYVAVENTYASEFKVYDLDNCAGERCAAFNYWPQIAKQIPSLMHISHVRFLNQGMISFDAESRSSSAGGSYLIAPRSSITNLIDYLGLGDSYSSGEGAYDYLIGADTDDNRCHLSSHSYPILLTSDLFSSAGGHSVACSGAVMHDITDTRDTYRGQVRGVANYTDLSTNMPQLLSSVMTNYLPGYISQQRFLEKYLPTNATLTISGNDVGFGDILARCIIPIASAQTSSNVCFATYEDRQELLSTFKRSGNQLTSLFAQLKRASPLTHFYAVGYPQIAVDNGNCGLNVHFNTSELEFMHELIVQLNATIAASAKASGVDYVDVSEALAGHRLCESNTAGIAVNGLTAGTDIGLGVVKVIGKESYHPNALGQQLIEQAILQKTKNFTSSNLASAPLPSPDFAKKPTAGRTIYSVIPSSSLTQPSTYPGSTVSIAVDRVAYGFALNTTLQVKIGDVTNNSIVQIISGSETTTITLPASTPPGVTTIHIIGTGQAGQPMDVVQVITVGQGTQTNPVPAKPCPIVDASGVDADHDGIDDACDPVISLPPVSPPAPTTTNELTVKPSTPAVIGTTIQNMPPHILQTASSPVTQTLQPASNQQILAFASSVQLAPKPVTNPFNLTTTNSKNALEDSQYVSLTKPAKAAKPYRPGLPSVPWQLWLACLVLWVLLLLLAHGLIGKYAARRGQGSRTP